MTPWNFLANKLWSFRRPRVGWRRARPPSRPPRSQQPRCSPPRPPGRADGSGLRPEGNPIEVPFVPPDEPTPAVAHRAASHPSSCCRYPKVADWVDRYPAKRLSREATSTRTPALGGEGLVASGRRPDRRGQGGRLDRPRHRGVDGPAGRLEDGPRLRRGLRPPINEPWIWLSFCAVFLLGLADFRRPLSVRNLDLLVLLSFELSLYFFNQGRSSRRCRSCTRRSSTSSGAWSGSAGAGVGAQRVRSGRCGCCSPRRSSSWASASA